MGKVYDFSGWATRNNIRCSDGRTILRDAFKDNDGKKVPLVWNHQHNDSSNVLGHAMLENREDGVYAYCTFNETEAGQNAKLLVQHGDVTALSIYANKLKQKGSEVVHGAIREVSLVLAGANPGAYIDCVLAHGEDEEGFIMYTGEDNLMLYHASMKDEDEDEDEDIDETEDDEDEDIDETEEDEEEDDEKMKHSENEDITIGEIVDSMTDEQKKAMEIIVGMAIEDTKKENGGDEEMKHNVFESDVREENVLTHSDMENIFADAKRIGSLKEATASYLEHAYPKNEAGNTVEYGIADIEWLMPEYKNVTDKPQWIKQPDDWVAKVMNGVKHTPFSRIKSMFADITEDEARARGYVKGNLKIEEVFTLIKRTTDPQTIYKKQKLDRDDIIDITDFDVVAWLKGEMRMMLDKEIARAILIGDGRSTLSADKIKEDHIRSILNDHEFYSMKKEVKFASGATEDQKAKAVIRAAVKARKDYRGAGTPTLFTTEDVLTDMLLMEDTTGRVIYDSETKLATALRVKEIVTVPEMEGLVRKDSDNKNWDVIGIIVNLQDYNVGADKGGAVAMFDDFDIDYNQYKYLIETRCSGALVNYHSAIVLESAAAQG